MYDIRPDRIGWTVYDIELGRPLLLGELRLVGLEHEAADELASLLNRSVYRPCSKRREAHGAPSREVAARHSAQHHQARPSDK
jgi:hypothetical protein